MSKVLLIDNCTECGKWFIRYGFSKACRKLGRKLTSLTDEIPYDCPLLDAEEKENAESNRL